MGFSGFARRYFRNRVFFLFLRLLRCFSSPGSLHKPIYSAYGDGGLLRRVSPFGYPRLSACLRLRTAFRSLPRPSSAPSARASAPCLSSLNLFLPRLAWRFRPAWSSQASVPMPSGMAAPASLPLLYFPASFDASSIVLLHESFPIHVLGFGFNIRFSRCNRLSDPVSRHLNGLKRILPPLRRLPSGLNGLKWTRTTDLTLIRRAL